MKLIGLILIAIGLSLLIIVAYTFLQESNKTISPLPEEKGVKVILVSPTP